MALTAKKVYAILKRQISDMEAKLNSPVRYRGTVATADLLPLNPDIGDMYNIESKSIYGEAGMNVAWNGVVWDTMGAPIDMSLYIKSSELADWVKQQNKPTYTAEEVGALPADTKIPSKTSDLQNDSGFLTKIPDNYLSGTDKTLSVSEKAADAKATGDKITELSDDISNKLNKNQGSENSGKIAGINESGDIVPMFPIGVEYNSETNCLEFGSDQKMELNQGIGLDSTLTKSGSAADAGATGKEINSLKEDLGNISDVSKLQKYVTKISLIAGQEYSGALIGVYNPTLDSGYITIQFSEYIDGLQWAFQRVDGSNIIGGRLSANKTEFNYVLNEQAYGIGFYVPSSSITETTTVDIIVTRNDNNYIEPTICNNVDGTSGISTKLETKGGNLILKKGIYNNRESIVISDDSVWLEGEVWNYPNHPNGVYESDNGCKIKMNNYAQPLIKYSGGNGVKISNIGLNGTVTNGDTYDLFKFDSTNLYCGIEIPSHYSDQFEISKVSFTGLGVGISGNNNEAMLDAFIFDKLNTDGCDFGVYLNINLIVYAKIMNSIIADTLGCGMYFNSVGANGILIENNSFVRNGGNFSPSQINVLRDNVCSVYLATLYDSIITKNFIHYAGTYKDTRNPDNIITTYQDTSGLVLTSHKSSLVNNSIVGCKKYGAILNGNYNLYSGNEMLYNHNGIVVNGNNNNFSNNTLSVDENDTTTPALTVNGYTNVVSGNNFLNGFILVNGSDNIIHRFGSERIVLSDSAWNNTLIGFDESQITAPSNHGTIIK